MFGTVIGRMGLGVRYSSNLLACVLVCVRVQRMLRTGPQYQLCMCLVSPHSHGKQTDIAGRLAWALARLPARRVNTFVAIDSLVGRWT